MIKYTDDVPTTTFALFLGLYVNPRSKYRNFQQIYKFFVTSFLFIFGIRRAANSFTTPKGLTPWYKTMNETSVVLTTCGAIFFISGAIACIFIDRKKEQRIKYFELFGDYKSQEQKKAAYRKSLFLAVSSITYSFISASCAFFFRRSHVDIDSTQGYTVFWILRCIEFYLTFLCQSSIMILVVTIVESCGVLQQKIGEVHEKITELGGTKSTSSSDALSRVEDLQKCYNSMVQARNMLEELASFPLFYIYSISVPACCLLAFLSLQNLDGSLVYLVSVNVFMVTMVGSLVFASYPAFKIHEEGERLISRAILLYYQALSQEKDNEAKMTFLVFQMHSTKLTLSASNYFPLEKKILLALFSTITTNFLILVQFSEKK